MLNAVTVTNYLGNSLRMELANPFICGLAITSIKGLGPADADINITDMSTADGGLYNSARLKKRTIVFDITFVESTMNDTIEKTRLLTYKYFPIEKRVKLVFEEDARSAEIYGYVEENDPDIFSKNSGCTISIVCPDPYFYSTGEDGIKYTTFSGVESNFEFPFENNSLDDDLIEFGIIERYSERSVFYQGDAEIGCEIIMHAVGEVGDIAIYNTGTRERMFISAERMDALTGSHMMAGDTITINTVKGNKSITLLRNGIETNILNCLDKNADWFQLAKGDNVFTYTASIGAVNLQFKIKSKTVYEGI